MSKRGQIALFVIIGVLLVTSFLLVYFLKPEVLGIKLSPEEAQKIVTSQVQPIRDYTDECMLFAARKTLNTMGRQGGYVLPPTERAIVPSEVMSDAPVMTYALFYDKDQGYVNYLPSTVEMKEELATFLENNFDFVNCIDNYNSFRKIVELKIVDKVKVNRDKMDIGDDTGQIIIPYSYPVEISKGNASALIEEYELTIPINLARIRTVAAAVNNKVATNGNYMEVVKEESEIGWNEIKNNPNSEQLLLSAESFTQLPSEFSGKRYDDSNILFKIEYSNPSLSNPYNFYFLVGRQ